MRACCSSWLWCMPSTRAFLTEAHSSARGRALWQVLGCVLAMAYYLGTLIDDPDSAEL